MSALLNLNVEEVLFDPSHLTGAAVAKPRPPGPGSYNSHFYGSIAHRARKTQGTSITGRNFAPSVWDKQECGPGPAAYTPRKQNPKNGKAPLAGKYKDVIGDAEQVCSGYCGSSVSPSKPLSRPRACLRSCCSLNCVLHSAVFFQPTVSAPHAHWEA